MFYTIISLVLKINVINNKQNHIFFIENDITFDINIWSYKYEDIKDFLWFSKLQFCVISDISQQISVHLFGYYDTCNYKI